MGRLHTVVRLVTSLAVVATVLAGPLQARAADRVALPGHVVPLVAEHGAMRATVKRADTADIALTVVLRRNDEAGFRRDLAALYEPTSPTYRRWMTPQEIADRYGPSPDDYALVEGHFAAAGFRVLETSANRMTLTLAAPRSVVERTLDVELVDYELPMRQGGKRRAMANDREPSLPAAIAHRVAAVGGLSTVAIARRVGIADGDGHTAAPTVGPLIREKIGQAGCAILDQLLALAGGTPPQKASDLIPACGSTTTTTSSNGGSGGSSSDPRPAAGDPDPGPWLNVTGADQRIGLVQFDTYVPSDVADFAALLRMPPGTPGRVTRVAINGGAPLGLNQSEVLLDIAFILPAAPGATVTVYDSPFTGAGSFQALFNRAISDGMTIISNSWAYCENETSAADVQSLDSVFATAAAAGISIFNASGDTGSTCLNGSPNTLAFPASAPQATAVGGTTQQRGPGATLAGETWWDGVAHSPPTGRSGYGLSRFFTRPAYQDAFHAQPFRSVPDVVTNADPATGIHICQASDGGCPTGKLYGGTSVAAPSMAAYVALLNQARSENLGFVNPAFYALAGTEAFRSPASLGVDFARAGIGSPNINALHVQLHGIARGPASAARSTTIGYLNGVTFDVVETIGGIPADGTTPLAVVVTVRDANGHTLPGKTVTLAANPPSVTITPPSTVTSVNNGAAVFSVTGLALQNVSFTATVSPDGIQVPMPLPIPFVTPLVASAGIQAFPTTVANNGTATTTITVTLQDALARPAAGKVVQLAQGSGRSLIVAPTPPVTNAAGQIQFTATNTHAEVVTYTALIKTDGDVAVPGSADVTYSGNAPTSCVTGAAPVAAPGYAMTPFATGFSARTFSFSNVNWGCSGASNPAFRPDGSLIIANFSSGALYSLPAEGGAASSGNIVANPGLTIGQPVWGKDGKLYAFRSATGAGFFSGAIYELDPMSGATLRTLASGLACLSPMSVDPISGDLFFTGTCFGAGSDDPRLYRVRNPGSATPAVETYATLPGTPNGALSFAPDGTIFVATQYLLPAPPVVRVTGTHQPQPPAVTPVSGLAAFFWVTVAETLPGGAAKSLVFLATDNKMKLADITVSPPTITELIDKPMSSGVIGPDGCLYLSDLETVHKLTQANGACGFTPTNPSPAIRLTPAVTSPDPAQGSIVTLTATLVGVPPTADVPVEFRIRGANPQFRIVRTDASGTAQLVLRGDIAGQDRITATATVGSSSLVSATARVRWTTGQHTAFVAMNGSVQGSIAGQPVQLTASLSDISLSPNAPIAGVSLAFSVGGQSCNAVTNASGIASCSVTIAVAGVYTLTVTFTGNSGFTASSAASPFTVGILGPPPCLSFDDVDSTSPFCPSVEWIRNRSITFGCLATLYCAVHVATRLQMAAFMTRLGGTLTGRVLFAAFDVGVVDLDAGSVVCQTEDVTTGTYGRRAVADGVFAGMATTDTAFAAEVVASVDGGASWTPVTTVVPRGFAAASHWGHVRASGMIDLLAAQTVRFGLRISRDGQTGATDLTDSRCKLRVGVGNR